MSLRVAYRMRVCLIWLGSCVLLASASALAAQQLPPIEPPLPMPSAHPENAPTIRVTTREVLVPTLVELHNGAILYGLKQNDFVLEDDGVPQKIRVQEEMDTAPVALVVAVEEGGMSALEFDKLSRLGPLLDLFLVDSRSQAALIGFDSTPHLLCDFTHASGEVENVLRNDLQPGDGGDAILDTVSYAVDLLQTQPENYRRVLLLISEERDHRSKHTRIAQLIRKIGQSDVLVLSVSFSPARAEFGHDLKDSGSDRTMNMVSALAMLIQAFKKNASKEIAHMSGGEYQTFASDKRFEQKVIDAAKHMRNRYLITFSPSNPTPGLHTIRVRTAQDYGARIVARANYWIGPDQEAPDQ